MMFLLIITINIGLSRNLRNHKFLVTTAICLTILVNITRVLPSKMDASKNMDSETLKVSYNFGVYTIEHANPVLVGLWMISYS